MASRDEELKRLEELERLAELEAMESEGQEESNTVPEGMPALSARTSEGVDPVVYQSEAAQKVSQFDAVVTGMLQSIPFAKQTGAAIEAVRQATSGETELSVDAISENYKRNKANYEYSTQRVKDAYPITHEAADMTAGVIRGLVQPSSIPADIASGFIEGASRDENLNGAYGGALSGFVFNRLGAGMGRIVTGMGKLARESSEEATRNAVGGMSKAEIRRINQHLAKTNQTIEDFSKNMYGQKLYTVDTAGNVSSSIPLFESGQTFEETLEKVRLLRDRSGKEIGAIINSMDEALGPVAVKPDIIHSRLREDILAPLIRSDSPDHQALAKQLDTYLEDIFMEKSIVSKVVDGKPEMEISKVYKQGWSLARLQNLKVDIANKVSKEFQKLSGGDEIAISAQKREVVSKLTDYIEEAVDEGGSKIDADSLSIFKRWKKEYGNLALAEELLEKKAYEKNGGPLPTIQKMLQVKGLLVGVTSHMAGVDPVTSAGIAATFNQFLNSPAAPATMAVGMKRLADFIQNNPNSQIASRVLVGAGQSLDTFRNSLSSSISELELRDNPIKRDTADLLSRQGTITSLLDYHAPEAAKRFRTLVEDGDETALATFLSELSQDPRAKKFIEPGMGVNGKAWTDADKAVVEEQIRGWNPPAAVRMEMIENLRQTGAIPDQNWILNPPKKYSPRDKSKPQY